MRGGSRGARTTRATRSVSTPGGRRSAAHPMPCACAQEVLKACKAAIKKAKKALKEALKGDDALGDLIAAR